MKRSNATNIQDEAGHRYHIGLKPGDLAERIVMVGDPARVELVAKRFSKIRLRAAHREFVTVTGTYKGMDLSAMGTGIGPDNTEIALIEACQITKNPTFIRCGTTGGLQPEIRIGDLIISKAALRLDSTTDFFVHDRYPAVADPDVTLALATACAAIGARFHVGITATAPGFYGAQGRDIPGFPVRFPQLPDELARQGVTNFEMEASALFTLASLRRVRAGAVCVTVAGRPRNEFADEETQRKGENKCVDASLKAFEILKYMDQERKKRHLPMWVPAKWARK
ncbi:MAG: nucleoside phosphorylase [Pseudomonadota bacterium]